MTLDVALELAIDLAYLILLVVAVVDYVRRPSRVRLSVVSVFGSVALVFLAGALARWLPGASVAAGIVSSVTLFALPFATFLLVGQFRRLPPWTVRVSGAMFVALAVLSVALALGVELGLSDAASLVILLAAVGYFVIVEGAAATLLWIEARRRAAASRTRLTIAAVATGLLSVAVLVLGAGGLATVGDSAAQGAVAFVVRLLSLAAAVSYLAVFLPPPWLRRLGQQAIGYRFMRELNPLTTGTPPARIWELLTSTARAVTGARGAAVVLTNGMPTGISGDWSDGPRGDGREQRVTIPMSIDGRPVGTLDLVVPGSPLFVDDDIELLSVLSIQAIRAVDREQVLVERDRLIADLRAASSAKSDFLAAMSHELRTPLNAIIGFSELLLLPSQSDATPHDAPTVGQYADHIHDAGLHLLDLINEVLDLARVEAGKLDLRPGRFDLTALVAGTVETMRPLADQRQVSLSFPSWERLEIDADQGRIRQVVFNLLSNAIKFTPRGGRVDVALANAGLEARFTVTDSGPGIALVDRERIFEAFQQSTAGDVAGRGGTGLGLALARQLVEAHGGRIELVSTVGEGSQFTVVLPLAPSDAPAATIVAPAGDPSSPVVLVIEDDPAALRLLRVYLEDAGYRVSVASDAASGIRAAVELQPAAIILDIHLPDLDGWDVLQRLKASEATCAIPIVVVSVIDDAPLGLALGAIDYFVKPVGREALLASLGRLTFTTKVRTQPISILVIDDDAAAQRDYRRLLEPSGFTVVSSLTGTAGLETARTTRPDLILLGLAIPDLNGFDLVAKLKAEASTREIPIWVATAGGLSAVDKARLNGQVLGFVEREEGTFDALKAWLERVAVAPSGATT